MTSNVQMVGEKRFYQQNITGDTSVPPAVWSVSPTGPTLSGQQDTNTSSVIAFQSAAVGIWTLSVAMTTPDGQIVIGQIEIVVVKNRA